jgi:hypothetical protein
MAASGRPAQVRDFAPDQIEFVVKDPNSAAGECKSFHRVSGGTPGWIVNGDPLSPRAEDALQHRGPGEVAAFIDDETLDALIAARAAQAR